MKRFICLTLLLSAGLVGGSLAAERPNIVLMMSDDQGYGDFGATGNPVIETPHIDRMARESVSMRTFYVSPVCSPTRANLMTGRYNYRTRVIDTYLGRSMMDPEEVTIAEVLHGAGYATGIFGKWHLGDCYPMRPIDQGFEQALVHRGGGLAQPSEPLENQNRYTDPILFRNGEKVRTKGYCTDVYFDAAIEFIEQARRNQRSFFVYLPTNAPHDPFHDVPEDLRRHYMTKTDQLAELLIGRLPEKRQAEQVDRLARIAAMITNIDRNVGRLLAKLDALGLAENTIVLYLVDNGPAGRRYVGPFRGSKSDVHEGGIRSPLWIRWPAKLTPEMSRDEAVAHIDVMPTLLDACGVRPPDGPKLDGRSFLPLLLDSGATWPERPIVIQSHRGDEPMRYHHFMVRQGPWKLLNASGFGRETLVGEPKFELYNVVDDAGETRNLIDDEPQIAARLKAAYDAWFDNVSSTRPDNYAPPRIPVGTPHENPTVLTRQDWRGGTWARDSIGHWKLRVATAGKYDIRLVSEAADTAETAELTIRGNTKVADVPGGSTAYTFEDVELTAGDAELEAALCRQGKRRGVYQVEVLRDDR
ncbi:MAG: arylsulfatase [Rhodopirellula sp.]|nr:arylsulfatase [Rhodopirellula sp.]